MALLEYTLWGDRDKVKIAIERLRQFEPPEGYWLAFSGGKDSVTLKALADMAGVRYAAHYSRTTVDPPELERFIRQCHPDVIWHYPEKSMFQLILEKEFWPPMRQQRWCCELLKEGSGEGIILTGVRWAESGRRKQRKMIEPCFRDRTKTYLMPIIDWANDDVWEFIRVYGVPYCSLYDEGFERLGCILCPMSGPMGAARDIARWPKFAAAYVRTFDKLIEKRAELGKKITFKTGQQLFDWWIRRNSKPTENDQMVMF